MLEQHLMLYIKHIDLTRLGTKSGAADDGKRASSVAWSCMPGRKALGEGGRGDAPSLGAVTGAVDFGSWFGLCGARVGLLGASPATFFRFWARLCLKLRFEAICFDFGSILGGFWFELGWILGRFFQDF